MSYRERYRDGKSIDHGTKLFSDGGVLPITRGQPDHIKDISDGTYSYLSIAKHEVQGSRVTGFEDDYIGRNEFDYPSVFWDWLDHYVHTPSDLDLGTRALSGSNPNVSDRSLPNILFELKELPSLIKQSGDIALNFIKRNLKVSDFASANLAYQFGISPMVQDVQFLTTAASSINKRMQDMQSVRKYGGLNKKKRLGKYSTKDEQIVFLETNKTFLYSAAKRDIQCSVWGISKWILSNQQSPFFDDHSSRTTDALAAAGFLAGNKSRINATRIATGTYGYNLSDLWEIIPWSWLIDYFANCGEIMRANENSLGLTPTKLAICRHYTGSISHPEAVSWTGNSRCTAGTVKLDLKTRMPVDISSAQNNLHMKFEMLTPNQIGLLSSIAITRKSGRSGQSNPYSDWANRLVGVFNRN